MTKQTWRKLRSKRDIERIKCSTMNKSGNCPANAMWCNTVHWEVNGMTGVSFFYHCAEHGPEICVDCEQPLGNSESMVRNNGRLSHLEACPSKPAEVSDPCRDRFGGKRI